MLIPLKQESPPATSVIEFINTVAFTTPDPEPSVLLTSISANIGLSHITGTEEAILEQQLSSRRYFQRPDADYVDYDDTRTALTGYGAKLFAKTPLSAWLV